MAFRRSRSPSPEQIAAARARRAELAELSKPLQAARKSGLLPWAECVTLNECLLIVYRQRTGQSDFETFMGWKERGFAVDKGAKGFAVWGQPIHTRGAKDQADRSEPNLDAGAEAESSAPSFFPVSYLFHAGQVHAADGSRPASFAAPNPFLALVASQPLALTWNAAA